MFRGPKSLWAGQVKISRGYTRTKSSEDQVNSMSSLGKISSKKKGCPSIASRHISAIAHAESSLSLSLSV